MIVCRSSAISVFARCSASPPVLGAMAGSLQGRPAIPTRRRGKVELAVARTLRGLEPVTGAHEGLAAAALVLAAKLDGDAGLATAAVARELRATLGALTASGRDEGDDGFAALVAGLSAPVEHAP